MARARARGAAERVDRPPARAVVVETDLAVDAHVPLDLDVIEDQAGHGLGLDAHDARPECRWSVLAGQRVRIS